MPFDNIQRVSWACIIQYRVSSQLEFIYLAFAHIYISAIFPTLSAEYFWYFLIPQNKWEHY